MLAEAQSKMIKVLTLSISDLITHEKCDPQKLGLASDVAFAELMSGGVEQALELGDLEVAIELRQTITFQAFATHLDKRCQDRICQAAFKVASSGYVDLERSKQFLNFARDCIKDEEPDLHALRTMMEHKSESLFRLCLEEGLDVKGCAEDGQGLLHYMINTGFHSLVPISLFIDKGADPFHASNNGQTPLNLAVEMGISVMVNEMLSKGANPLAAENNGSSTLHHATNSWNYPVVEIRKMWNENKYRLGVIDSDKNKKASVALQTAAKYHDIEMIKLLLRNGARTDLEDSHEDVALDFAVQGPTSGPNCAVSCCQLLCKATKVCLPRNKDGNTPLHYAAERHKGDCLRDTLALFVKQLRADVNVQNKRSETILHVAARQCSIEVIPIVCEFGAAPNLKDCQGLTAMHLWVQAALRGAIAPFSRDQEWDKILMAMIDAGADPLLLDGLETGRGFTAMEYAAMNGNDGLFCAVFDIATQFLCGAQVLQSSSLLKTQGHWLSSAWHLSVVEEQWRVVRELLLNRPEFDADISLLEWPKGARLLKYAIAVNDSQLLRRFSQTAYLLNTEPFHLLAKEYSERSKYSDRPSVAKARAWENSFRYDEVHLGRDQLNEIFEFLAIQDWRTIKTYFENANHERHLASEYAFRWESTVNHKTSYSAGLFLHGRVFHSWD